MTPDRHPDRTDVPEMDPARAAEIRALLIRTVAGTPRPRVAKLSRPAFALAATAALVFAGGVGAGTVVAYDRLTNVVVAEDSSGPESAEAASGLSGEAASAVGQDEAASESSSDSDLFLSRSDELTPVLTINGQTGYAYLSDLYQVRIVSLGAVADTAESESSIGQIPIYLADGVTLMGYFDPATLIP
ncbi:hypothetical protein BJQ94_07220 [Cryobacterium sp. SO2]|uniref:hypothetical protein n=1 Tax=Cryobacterium sp. SO2 TaxID=1897060 RepID=UPI00223DDB73|nr:hypothetical protein [Cryobacterium sp. SO2]WEO78813.1 hypothetical protein BJQ94_07220 [Cryobacterium sp. SO2]